MWILLTPLNDGMSTMMGYLGHLSSRRQVSPEIHRHTWRFHYFGPVFLDVCASAALNTVEFVAYLNNAWRALSHKLSTQGARNEQRWQIRERSFHFCLTAKVFSCPSWDAVFKWFRREGSTRSRLPRTQKQRAKKKKSLFFIPSIHPLPKDLLILQTLKFPFIYSFWWSRTWRYSAAAHGGLVSQRMNFAWLACRSFKPIGLPQADAVVESTASFVSSFLRA